MPRDKSFIFLLLSESQPTPCERVGTCPAPVLLRTASAEVTKCRDDAHVLGLIACLHRGGSKEDLFVHGGGLRIHVASRHCVALKQWHSKF